MISYCLKMQDYFACFPILISIMPGRVWCHFVLTEDKVDIALLIEVEILGIFRQAVSQCRQDVVAQGQLVGDFCR